MNLLQVLARMWSESQRTQGMPRSPRWKATRKEWLLTHPFCRGCGTTRDLEVHHKVPFWVNPALELARSNLITLCEWRGCHFRLGHCFLWQAWNPFVEEDCDLSMLRIEGRRTAA